MAHCEYSYVCLCVNVSVHMVVGGIQAGVSLRRSLDGDTSASMMSLHTDEGYCGAHSNSFYSLSQLPRKAPTQLEGGTVRKTQLPLTLSQSFYFPFSFFSVLKNKTIVILSFTSKNYFSKEWTSKLVLFYLLETFEMWKTCISTLCIRFHIRQYVGHSLVYMIHIFIALIFGVINVYHNICDDQSFFCRNSKVMYRNPTQIPLNCQQWALHVI